MDFCELSRKTGILLVHPADFNPTVVLPEWSGTPLGGGKNSVFLVQSFIQSSNSPRFGPPFYDAKDHQNGADAAGNDGNYRPKQCRCDAGFKRTELVRSPNEDIVYGGNAATHFIGGDQLHDGPANNYADAVEGADEKEHR